jgi:PAS domain S-box-containing protein
LHDFAKAKKANTMTDHGVRDFSREVSLSHSIKILDDLPLALVVIDAEGVIHEANPLAVHLIGSTLDTLLKKNLHQFIARDDQEDFTHWLLQLSSEQPPWCQVRMLRKQRMLPLQLRAGRFPSMTAGVSLYLVTMMESVHPKQVSEPKADLVFQSAVLDSIGEAVIATDLSGDILYWNKAAELIYGWKAEEILGKNIISITPDEDNRELCLEIMAALQAGEAWSGEFIVKHRDGHHFPAHVTDTCLRDQQGELSVIIGVSSDLTEKKLLEQQRQRLETELYEQKLSLAAVEKMHLEEASRFKSDFIANMSHEIRTPLAVIRGYAEILAEGPDAGSVEHIQSILRASRQVETLVNDILDISKIEAGKIEVEFLPTPIAVILDDIKEMFSLAALEKNLDLNSYIDPGVPPLIQTDPMRLKQILLNVVGNAIKFTHAGEVSIKVHMLQRGAQNLLSFVICDSGIGMTPEQSAKIFGAYSQADRSTTRKYGGTGLGLSLSLRLAQLLGGDLILKKSQPGQGSSFQLTINPGPLVDGAVIHRLKESAQSSTSKRHRSEAALRDMKILIVEDAEDVRAIVRQVLERQRALVTEAVNGEDAMRLTREAYFDAVLMDLQMPICDGFNATRRLRAEGYDVPIFALTAHAMAGERDRCMAAGFSGYLTKPINFKDMIAILSQEKKFAQDPLRSNER